MSDLAAVALGVVVVVVLAFGAWAIVADMIERRRAIKRWAEQDRQWRESDLAYRAGSCYRRNER